MPEAIAEFERGTDAGPTDPDGGSGSVDGRAGRPALQWHSASMAQPTPSLYALDPALPVLLRPDGAVQVGWSPRRAVLIRPPRGLNPAGLATLLRTVHSPVPISELRRHSDLSAGELVRTAGRGAAVFGRQDQA